MLVLVFYFEGVAILILSWQPKQRGKLTCLKKKEQNECLIQHIFNVYLQKNLKATLKLKQ